MDLYEELQDLVLAYSDDKIKYLAKWILDYRKADDRREAELRLEKLLYLKRFRRMAEASALAAFKAFGARRIGVLTPYAPAVNEVVRRYLDGRGVEVAAFGTFNKLDDREAARMSPDSIGRGITALSKSAELDAVFVSCTSLRLSERIEEIERAAGIPVTSSDHALAWHCLRLAGVDDVIAGAGRLFTLQAA